MSPEDFIEIMGSPLRLMILRLLAERPRSIGELSHHLNVTPQAIQKHLRILQRFDVISTIPIEKEEGSIIKKLYRSNLPIDIDLSSKDGILSISAHIVTDKYLKKLKRELPLQFEKNLLKTLQEIDYEKASIKRNLHALREKEFRLFNELIELEVMEDRVIEQAKCSIIEEAILKAYLKPDADKELPSLISHLGIDRSKVLNTLKRFGADL
ncbi:MAG: ArsR family transcriptional regulator [Nitrososphaerales archaeon]|nr:ArsR family transcriptional regulator [Nitrososphaerales archaeon]